MSEQPVELAAATADEVVQHLEEIIEEVEERLDLMDQDEQATG